MASTLLQMHSISLRRFMLLILLMKLQPQEVLLQIPFMRKRGLFKISQTLRMCATPGETTQFSISWDKSGTLDSRSLMFLSLTTQVVQITKKISFSPSSSSHSSVSSQFFKSGRPLFSSWQSFGTSNSMESFNVKNKSTKMGFF